MTTIPPREVLLEIYSKMSLLFHNDEKMRAAIRTGRLIMPYYSYRGQEAIPAAISSALTDQDQIATIYRGIHDMLAKGCPLDQLWAEVAGKASGTCKGKGGPMHITHPASGTMVTTGVVGSSLPLACGLAWGAKLQGKGAVAVAYFGDGASNIGAFHESLNLASVWKLPVIFVCSNNLYGEHTRYEAATAIDSIARRADSYSMPGVQVNGNDPVALYEVATQAIARARAGEGPTLIEAMTFRFFGHVFGDTDAYMAAGEKEARAKDDPWPNFRAFLLAGDHASEAELDNIDAAHKVALEAALQFALASPVPDLSELRCDVYADEVCE